MGKNTKKEKKLKNKNKKTSSNLEKYDLNKKDIRLIANVENTVYKSQIGVTVSILGPEKHFKVPLLIEIQNYHLNIKENHRFDINTYGLPHHSLYNFNFEKVIYYPYSRTINGKHKETYNINLFISIKYKTSGINPIYMHQLGKDINPVRGWIIKFEEPSENCNYHTLYSHKKDVYPNSNEDRNLNPYNQEKAIKDIISVKKRYTDKLIKYLDKKEGEFKSIKGESGLTYKKVAEDKFEELSLLQKISLMSGNTMKHKEEENVERETKDNETNTVMKENIKKHIKGHNKTLKCKIRSLTNNKDIDVFDLSSIEEGNEDEQLEKLADDIYKCISKKKTNVLKNSTSDKLVEKSSKIELSSELDLEKAIKRLKQPIPKEFVLSLPRLPELKI